MTLEALHFRVRKRSAKSYFNVFNSYFDAVNKNIPIVLAVFPFIFSLSIRSQWAQRAIASRGGLRQRKAKFPFSLLADISRQSQDVVVAPQVFSLSFVGYDEPIHDLDRQHPAQGLTLVISAANWALQHCTGDGAGDQLQCVSRYMRVTSGFRLGTKTRSGQRSDCTSMNPETTRVDLRLFRQLKAIVSATARRMPIKY